jgi:tetratricopeptide (TPR) repeat protein
MLVALLPTLVVPLNVLVNEHRLYLPLFGLVVALLGLSKLEETPGLRLGAPLLLGLLALMTWERNGVWRDEFALWSDAHAKNPTATRPLVYMGNAARAARDPQAAEGYYVQALALEPDNAVVRANLANAYENMGRHRQAIDTFAGILSTTVWGGCCK